MRKKYFFILCFFCSTAVAQQHNPSFVRIIKVAAADSLAPIKETVKAQLQKAGVNKRQNNALRLLVAGGDKTGSGNIGRWVAAKQQQDIYRVDLSALVSKYIGETEKNLEQVFAKAAQQNCVLLFDEADALFGKRSGETGTSNAAAGFVKYCNAFKGTVLITCMGDDCINAVIRQKFISISGG